MKHGGGSVMAWACMAASGTGSLVFIDDVTADKSSRMNSEVFRAILSAHIQPNASELIGRRFTVQMDNDPKHTAKATKEFLKGKKWTVMQWPSQSPDLNPIEHAFHLLKTKLKGKCPKNKQERAEPVQAQLLMVCFFCLLLVHTFRYTVICKCYCFC